MFYQKILFVCLFICLSCSLLFAGGGKTPDSCAGVGALTVHCYQCSPTQKKYLGKAAVLAGYEEDKGEKYCLRLSDARAACSSQYNIPSSDIGFYVKYSIGLREYEETCCTSCVQEVGKR